MNEQNLQLVQQAYADFATGNVEALLSHFANDIEWINPTIPNVPQSGNRNGLEQLALFFAQVAENDDIQRFEPQEFFAQGDKVVVLGTFASLAKPTGKYYETDFVHVFTIRDGKIVRTQEHTDTYTTAAAFVKTQSA
jgi:ketosteroid isomerase-like protein